MENTSHIVIVEDEVIIALDMQQCLEEFGYVVDDVCTNTTDALKSIETHRPDAVLMDIKLENGEDGTQIVRYIQETLAIPVVYVTAHSDEQTLKKAQVTKPYGYIVKPVDEHQLNSSIQIALFKSKHELSPASKVVRKDNTIVLGKGYHYDLLDKHIYKDGTPIPLTKKERFLISLLVDNMNKTMSYETIERIVWEGKPVNTATLRSLIRRVREKLGGEIIENVTSTGYRIRVHQTQ